MPVRAGVRGGKTWWRRGCLRLANLRSDQGHLRRRSGPKLCCPGGCGNSVDNIRDEGQNGAVLVVLGRERFWFCGVACASNGLNDLYKATYERGPDPQFMLLNTLFDN